MSQIEEWESEAWEMQIGAEGRAGVKTGLKKFFEGRFAGAKSKCTNKIKGFCRFCLK